MRGGAIGNSDLANDAVTASKVRASAVGNTELAERRRHEPEDQGRLDRSRRHRRRPDQASKIKDGEVVEGNGRMQSTALTLPDGVGFTTLLSVPGLGALRASCANGVATTQWQNTAPGW